MTKGWICSQSGTEILTNAIVKNKKCLQWFAPVTYRGKNTDQISTSWRPDLKWTAPDFWKGTCWNLLCSTTQPLYWSLHKNSERFFVCSSGMISNHLIFFLPKVPHVNQCFQSFLNQALIYLWREKIQIQVPGLFSTTTMVLIHYETKNTLNF